VYAEIASTEIHVATLFARRDVQPFRINLVIKSGSPQKVRRVANRETRIGTAVVNKLAFGDCHTAKTDRPSEANTGRATFWLGGVANSFNRTGFGKQEKFPAARKTDWRAGSPGGMLERTTR